MAIIIGLILALMHLLNAKYVLVFDYIFFGIFVIIVGIPHGAIDHLIEQKYLEKQRRSFSMVHFLFKYITQILIYALLWFFMPALSLALFLVLSAWHFGESDMQPAPKHPLWKISQIVLGSLILFFILMREPLFTADLILRITQENVLAYNSWNWAVGNSIQIYVTLLAVLIFNSFVALRYESLQWSKMKWIHLGLILVIIYFLPLLPAFAFYFGGWHSLNTFDHMSDFLDKKNSLGQLWVAALPFTLLAIFFMSLSAFIWSNYMMHVDPLPILFIFISVITLPHLLVMNKMFASK